MTLYGDFLGWRDRRIHKWDHYFPVYEQHFGRFRNQHVTIFEIGVGEGGSLQQWRRYFGPFAIIVGIDINAACKQVEEDQVRVRIGSQTDTRFLAQLLDEFGRPDIVIDDGSHAQFDIGATFDFLYPHVAKNGVYLVEDLHTAYWPMDQGGLRRPGTFIERAKQFVDQMHAEYTRAENAGGTLPRSMVGDRTRSIHFYDSIVVLEAGEYRPRQHRLTGDVALFDKEWMPPDGAGSMNTASGAAEAAEPPVPQAVLDQIVELQQHIRRLETGDTPPEPPTAARSALHARIAELEASLADERRSAAVRVADLETASATDRHLAAAQIGALQAQVTALRRSTSWRLTAPVRSLGRLLRR